MSNFMQYCHLCTSDENVLFTVLNLDSDDKSFADKLEAIVPKIVNCKIKLPNGICTICAVRLNDAYKFIQQCFDSQIILKRHLNDKLCRLCAGGDNITYSLTTMDSDNLLLSYKLDTIASEILQCTEKLSDCICSICSDRLNETYKFVEKCFKSHEILKQQSQNSEVMKNEINNESEIKDRNIDDIKLDLETDRNINTEERLEAQNNINFEFVYVKEEPISEESLESESLDLHSEIINNEEYSNFENETDITECQTSTNSNENDESVMKNVHKCTLCEKTFTQKGTLKMHIRIHTNERPYKCEICEKTFTRNEHLKVHFRTHTNEKPYECKICEKTFTRNENLKRHSRIHTNERSYKCEICEEQFTRNRDLIKHFRTHKIEERPYKCEICEKTFMRNDHLKLHFRIHTNEKPYKCEICEKTFSRVENLKRHVRTHTNEKPYKCEICDKLLTRSENLIKHFRTHTNEKPYKCEICEKQFNRSENLATHFRTHTKETRYKCRICEKAFIRSDNFKRHIRSHAEEKPDEREIENFSAE